MGQNTPRAGLYLPGGGSTGTITPDEVADIDKLNGNFTIIDGLLGAKTFASEASIVPSIDGGISFARAELALAVYDGLLSKIVKYGPMLRGTAAERATTTAPFKAFWQDTDAGRSLYKGDAAGKWRKATGQANIGAGAWAVTNGSTGAAFTGSRTPASGNLSTWYDAATEHLLGLAITVGTGYATVSQMGATTDGSTVSTVSFRQTQNHNTDATNNGIVFFWMIIDK